MALAPTTTSVLGLSTGTILLVAGVITIGGIIYYNKKIKTKIIDVEDLSSEDEKYERSKRIVESCINNNDIDELKKLYKNKNIIKHDELKKLIEDFLDKKSD